MLNKFLEKAYAKRDARLALGKKGFTLIELLAVIAIIAILVLIAAPSFLGYTKDAKVQTMNADAKVLTNAALVYQVENDTTDGTIAFPITANPATGKVTTLTGVPELKDAAWAEIDADAIKANVQSTKEPIAKYVIDKNTGKVYHKDGVIGKDGATNYGHGVKVPKSE